MRDSSPPEAIFSIGFNSSPRLGETRNPTSSNPAAVQDPFAHLDAEFSPSHRESFQLRLHLFASLPAALSAFPAQFSEPTCSYSAAAFACSFSRAARCSAAFSTSSALRDTSSWKAITSSIDPPYFLFSRSRAANRDSTSSSLLDPLRDGPDSRAEHTLLLPPAPRPASTTLRFRSAMSRFWQVRQAALAACRNCVVALSGAS